MASFCWICSSMVLFFFDLANFPVTTTTKKMLYISIESTDHKQLHQKKTSNKIRTFTWICLFRHLNCSFPPSAREIHTIYSQNLNKSLPSNFNSQFYISFNIPPHLNFQLLLSSTTKNAVKRYGQNKLTTIQYFQFLF